MQTNHKKSNLRRSHQLTEKRAPQLSLEGQIPVHFSWGQIPVDFSCGCYNIHVATHKQIYKTKAEELDKII